MGLPSADEQTRRLCARKSTNPEQMEGERKARGGSRGETALVVKRIINHGKTSEELIISRTNLVSSAVKITQKQDLLLSETI